MMIDLSSRMYTNRHKPAGFLSNHIIPVNKKQVPKPKRSPSLGFFLSVLNLNSDILLTFFSIIIDNYFNNFTFFIDFLTVVFSWFHCIVKSSDFSFFFLFFSTWMSSLSFKVAMNHLKNSIDQSEHAI